MSVFRIQGGISLNGEVLVSGSKNAVLPLLSSSLLTSSPIVLHGVPRLQDVEIMIRLLRELGVDIHWSSPNTLFLCAKNITNNCIPMDLVRAMRASILVVGPLLARLGSVQFLEPGGCAIGQRPIDRHLEGLSYMGVSFQREGPYIRGLCSCMKGASISFSATTVTGTENLMMAAVLADGVTVLKGAAQEPEIVDLANCLKKMGACIDGAGTPTIRVKGIKKLSPVEYRVMPDRIEAGTFLCAGIATRGTLVLRNVSLSSLGVMFDKLCAVGCSIKDYSDCIVLEKASSSYKGVDVVTGPYPQFPTDMQAPFVAMNSVLNGSSRVTETVFENRFMHVPELCKLGCLISIRDNTVHIQGRSDIVGATMQATDLRASAALIIGALCAQGVSHIHQMDFIDRGYEDIEKKLSQLGARVSRDVSVHS